MDTYKLTCIAEISADIQVPNEKTAVVNSFTISENRTESLPKIVFTPLDEHLESSVINSALKEQDSNKKEKIRGNRHRIEVFILLDENENSHEDALTWLFDYIEEFLDNLSFLTQSRNRIIEIQSIQNYSFNEKQKKDKKEQEILFFASSPQDKVPLPPLDMMFPKVSFSVRRALRYFRSGLYKHQLEDRFLDYYIALESISDDLFYQEERKHKCPSCGVNTGFRKMIKEGIITFADSIGISKKEVNKLVDIRSRIVHANQENSISNKELEPNLRQLEFILLQAIKYLRKFSPNSLPMPHPRTLWNIPDYLPRLTIKFIENEDAT